MARARVPGCVALILCCVLMSCGPAATATPPPVEWLDLTQAADLSALRSYRARYALRWEGTVNGQPKSVTWDVLQEFVQDPPARRFLWSEGDPGSSGGSESEFVQIGEEAYVNTGSGWSTVAGGSAGPFQGNPFLSAPLSVLASGRVRLIQRNVTVNSVAASHYAFDETTLGAPALGELSLARGDVWISTQFKVIVKYEAHYEGRDLPFGEGEQGVLDAAFDLMDINRSITIQSPHNSTPAAADDIPVLDDALSFTSVSGVIQYKTAKTQAEVTAFYEAQMPARGWTRKGEPAAGIIAFTKGSRTAQLVIESLAGKTSVMIITTE